MASNPLLTGINKTLRILKQQELLEDRHAGYVALVKQLAKDYQLATTSTQQAALSKEIRECLKALPTPPTEETPTAQNDTQDVWESIANV
ncbi:hypothetical protein ACIOJF_02535 [Glutamicibacter sp. NPDC087831]|uniref:hypothetical protein n=1 Tax=Glutamicibacter sp. NPDC087831 TaxID=3363998 RepID=UPI003808BD73